MKDRKERTKLISRPSVLTGSALLLTGAIAGRISTAIRTRSAPALEVDQARPSGGPPNGSRRKPSPPVLSAMVRKIIFPITRMA